MLRRTIVDQTTHSTPTYTTPYDLSLHNDTASQAHVEDYLDHYCAPLVGKVSYEERVRLRDDMRTQVESMISAHMELGSPRAQAIALTLKQFGHTPFVTPPVVPQIQQTAAVQETVTRPRAKGVWFGMFAFGLAMFLQAMTIASMQRAGSGEGLIALAMMAAFPFLAGLSLGYRNPDRPLRVMLRSMSWLALPTLGVTAIAMSDNFADGAFAMALVILFGNLVAGGIGTRFGTWMRRSGIVEKIDPPFHARVENGPYRMP